MVSSLSQFTEFLSSLELSELSLYRDAVNTEILKKLPKKLSPGPGVGSVSKSTANQVLNVTPHNIDDYISYNENFIDATVKDLVSSEIDCLNFNRHTRSSKLQNCFLSEFSGPWA